MTFPASPRRWKIRSTVSLFFFEVKDGVSVVINQQCGFHPIFRPGNCYPGRLIAIRDVFHIVNMHGVKNSEIAVDHADCVKVTSVLVIFEYDCVRTGWGFTSENQRLPNFNRLLGFYSGPHFLSFNHTQLASSFAELNSTSLGQEHLNTSR